MLSHIFRLPFTVALVAAMVAAVVVLLALGHSQAGTSQAAGTDGAMAVDCDAGTAGVQSNCAYVSGATFFIHFQITDPPDTKSVGYNAWQMKLRWNDAQLEYLPAGAANEVLWAPCAIPVPIDNQPDDPSLTYACAPFSGALFNDTGPMLLLEMQCQEDGNTPLELILAPGSASATHFTNAFFSPIDPTVTNATVLCGTKPTPVPPTDTPVPPTDTPVPPAPTPTVLSPPATLTPTATAMPTPLSPPATPAPTPTPLSPPATMGSINGTVTAEGTGDPLAEICLLVVDTSFDFHVHADTDASGNYTASGLPSGDYKVEFSDCAFPATYVTEWYNDRPDFDSADLVAVTQGSKTAGIDAALALGGSINGTVTAEETGTPLAEICVDVVDTSFNFFGFDFTDASGNYSVAGLPSGDYTVGFFDCGFPTTYVPEWYNDQPEFASADLVAVTQGVKTEGIDAALALGGSINGTVTAEGTGTPLAEICVFVEDPSFTFFGSGFTDASGNYSVGGLPSGDYTVGFFDCGFPATYLSEFYNDRPDFASADLVAVTQGVKTGGIDAALAVGGSINGTVTEEGTGDPLAGICVEVVDTSFNFFGFGFTDASGNYSAGGLPSGDYAVEFSDCEFGTHVSEWYDDQPDFSSADLVAVTQGSKTAGIDAALVDPTALTPTPTPVPGALIFVGEFAVTDPGCGGGDITITLDPAGAVIVSLAVVGFNVFGEPIDNVTEFDPPLPIAGDGSFSNSGPLPPPLDIFLSTFEGTFDFGVDPATVSGTLTIALVGNPSNVLCQAGFTADGPAPFGPVLTPSPTPPTDTPTATPDGDLVSSVQEATDSPSLPTTGAGALDAERGAGASLWAMIGALLVAAAAALPLFGWRYVRAR